LPEDLSLALCKIPTNMATAEMNIIKKPNKAGIGDFASVLIAAIQKPIKKMTKPVREVLLPSLIVAF